VSTFENIRVSTNIQMYSSQSTVLEYSRSLALIGVARNFDWKDPKWNTLWCYFGDVFRWPSSNDVTEM